MSSKSSPPKPWSEKRKSDFNFRFGTTIVLTIAYYVAAYRFFPFQLPAMETAVERVIFTLRWQIFGGLTLLMGMMGVMAIRGQSDAAADPIKGNAENLTKLPQNILQNTLEQFLFHFVGQIVLCTYLTSESMKVIPILVVLFVVARIIYKIGYQTEPMMRSYGFGSTFLPTLVVYGYCIYCFAVYGPGYGFGK